MVLRGLLKGSFEGLQVVWCLRLSAAGLYLLLFAIVLRRACMLFSFAAAWPCFDSTWSGCPGQLMSPHLCCSHCIQQVLILCRALRVVNPSPYMVYLQARGSILVASSPEILCRVGHDRKVINRSVCLLCSNTTTLGPPAQMQASVCAYLLLHLHQHCSTSANLCAGHLETKFVHLCWLFRVRCMISVEDHVVQGRMPRCLQPGC